MLSLTVLVFTGCGDDDDETSSNPLIGTWELTKDVYSECTDSSEDGIVNYTCTATDCITSTFTSNTITAKAIGDNLEISASATYSISGSKITINSDFGTDVAEFSVSGNTLNLTYEKDEDDGCILVETYTKQ